MESRPVKRRYFMCMHCERVGVSHTAERYRTVDHIIKHHLALDQAAFYCNLCMFRCTTREQLDKHVTGYKRHVLMASSLGGNVDDRNYLVQNPNAKPIREGVDYRATSFSNLPRNSLSKSHDTFDESGDDLLPATNQELVTVQLPPALLASLLSQKNQPSNASVRTPSSIQQASAIHTAGSTLVKAPVPVQQTPCLSQPMGYDPTKPSYSGTSLNPDPLNEVFRASVLNSSPVLHNSVHSSAAGTSVSMPSIPSSAFAPVVGPEICAPRLNLPNVHSSTPSQKDARSELHTPDLPIFSEDPLTKNKDEDIMGQILGHETESQMAFSPKESIMSPCKKMKTNVNTRDQECQTLTLEKLVEAQFAPITSVVGHLEKSMEASMSKVSFGLETVTRATRHLGATLETIANSMTNISQTLNRILEEKKREGKKTEPQSSSSKRAREEGDDKENKTLKSVIKKCNNKK